MWLDKVQTEQLKPESEVEVAEDVQEVIDVKKITSNMELLKLVSEILTFNC